MTRTPLKKQSKSPVAQAKRRIQELLRKIAIVRDGGCWVAHHPKLMDYLGPCGDYRQDGELILQYDHLFGRSHNISFADSRLGVCACSHHHYFHDTSYNQKLKDLYNEGVRDFIGPERCALLDSVKANTETHTMYLTDWVREEEKLKAEFESLKNENLSH